MRTGIIASPKNQWFLLGVLVIGVMASLIMKKQEPFTEREREIITRSDSVMYVTVMPDDSVILRTPSADLTAEELASPLLKTLMAKMLLTVQDPSQDGIGIAAPQVGINKRIIWLQRLDLPDTPWRCYLNMHIDSLYGVVEVGPEGCLSLPTLRGNVARSTSAIVSYVDPESMQPARDTVHGYTARIFQHEIDHLEGILYADRADSLFVSEAWATERGAFNYSRPDWWK